jgi:hypothetical protein
MKWRLHGLCGLLAIEIGKPKQRLYATLGKHAWVPQHERNEVLQPPMNRWMTGLSPKPWEVWDGEKRWHPNTWQ